MTIIGTSHIARQSLQEVRKAIEEQMPNLIALELDKQRYVALQNRKSSDKIPLYAIKRVGFKGFVFALIASWASKKLGQHVGVMPGSEMLQAMKLAQKHKIPVALIDQNIEVTLRNFSQSLSWKERWNFVVDLFRGIILRKKEITFDLRKVPEEKIIRKMMDIVKQRYPNIFRVLVTERNEYMAKRLSVLMQQHPDKKILAVVGAGHAEDILALLKQEKHKGGISYSFSFGALLKSYFFSLAVF